MARSPAPPQPIRRQRGFEAAGGLLGQHLRAATEKRGFAIARLLTHWAEIAGAEIAPLCQPVKISHAKGGMGATLTLLANGAAAPILQMQLPLLRERINACYGYNAIARISLTQTANRGFAEAQSPFAPAPAMARRVPSPAVQETAHTVTAQIGDDSLRVALERLACNVLSKDQHSKGTKT